MSIYNHLHSINQSLNRWLDQCAISTTQFSGWKRYGLAVLSGIGATLAMAPYYLLPLLVLSYSVFATLLRSESLDTKPRSKRRAFLTGWAFGFGYFVSGIYWMGFAFLVRAEEFAWMVPIVIPVFAAFLGFFFALPALIFTILRQRINISGWRLAALFAICISGFEYLRGHILTGLPWNLTGQAMAGWVVGAQSAAIYGVYGLGFIILALSCLPAFSVQNNKLISKGLIISCLGLLSIFIMDAAYLAISPGKFHTDIIISIVQPNIRQKDKINPTLATRNFEKLISLSEASSAGQNRKDSKRTPARYLVWPENAVSWIDEQPLVLDMINKRIAPETIVLSGSIRRDIDKDDNNQFYNTLGVIEHNEGTRSVTGFYDKHHLVPFGEYLPMKGLLQAVGLSQLAPVQDGFTSGEGPRTLNIGPAPFAPLICYETIFPGEMHAKDQRPIWLVTVTNDAWFGDDAGPKQHLDQARLRAIETGLPMARSANTGISALIDPYGRIIQKIPLYKQGIIDHALPQSRSETIYSKVGDSIFFLMLLSALVLVLIPYRRD